MGVKQTVKVFKALANETRFSIVSSLVGKEKCVQRIVKEINKSQPTVSGQLKNLDHLGIIQSRRDGRKIFYSLKDNRIEKILKIFNIGG